MPPNIYPNHVSEYMCNSCLIEIPKYSFSCPMCGAKKRKWITKETFLKEVSKPHFNLGNGEVIEDSPSQHQEGGASEIRASFLSLFEEEDYLWESFKSARNSNKSASIVSRRMTWFLISTIISASLSITISLHNNLGSGITTLTIISTVFAVAIVWLSVSTIKMVAEYIKFQTSKYLGND